MWVRSVVRFMLVLQFVVLSMEAVTEEIASDADSSLPNIWEDEVVTRMIRELLARDLGKEHEQRQLKRQYKREVTASPAVSTTKKAQTTRKATVTTQKAKKPIKVTQSGNKPKRVATTTSSTTRATVKPSTKPIVINTNLGDPSKAKVRKNLLR